MKVFNWNHEKNEILKRERGLSFEAVIFCIENGLLLDIVEHPNQDKYKGQKIYVVNFNSYAYFIYQFSGLKPPPSGG